MNPASTEPLLSLHWASFEPPPSVQNTGWETKWCTHFCVNQKKDIPAVGNGCCGTGDNTWLTTAWPRSEDCLNAQQSVCNMGLERWAKESMGHYDMESSCHFTGHINGILRTASGAVPFSKGPTRGGLTALIHHYTGRKIDKTIPHISFPLLCWRSPSLKAKTFTDTLKGDTVSCISRMYFINMLFWGGGGTAPTTLLEGKTEWKDGLGSKWL